MANEPENFKKQDDIAPMYQLHTQMQNATSSIRGFWFHQKKSLYDAVFHLDSEIQALDILVETMKDSEFINNTKDLQSFNNEPQIIRYLNDKKSRKEILDNYIKWYRAIIRLLSRQGFWFELAGEEEF